MTGLSQKQFRRLGNAFPDGCDVFGFGPFLFAVRRPVSRRIDDPKPTKVAVGTVLTARVLPASVPDVLPDVPHRARRLAEIVDEHGGEMPLWDLIHRVAIANNLLELQIREALRYARDEGSLTIDEEWTTVRTAVQKGKLTNG